MRPGRTRGEVAARLFFWVVVAGAAYRFYRLRFYVDFTDENDNTAVGWLLTQGETLYGSVFSHHMPLPYILAQAVAFASPTNLAWHVRVVPWLLYSLTALAIARSPLGRGDRPRAWLAAACFLVSISALTPPVLGHMLLADNTLGCLLAVLFAQFLAPLCFREPFSRPNAILGGVALSLAPATTLIGVYPAAVAIAITGLLLVTSAARRRLFREVAGPFLIAATLPLLLLMSWLSVYGSLGGLFDQALLFNIDVYAGFLPARSAGMALLLRAAHVWSRAFWSTSHVGSWFRDSPSFLIAASFAGIAGVIAASFLAVTDEGSRIRSWLPAGISALGLSAFVFSSGLRGGAFHALPVFVLALTVLFVLLSWHEVPRWGFASGAICLLAGGAVAVRLDTSVAASPSEPTTSPEAVLRAGRYVREHTTPDARVASFPAIPRFYLEARRKPATDSVFFLPWQAAWERSFYRRADTCSQLKRVAPEYVFLFPGVVWDTYEWADYAPCINDFIREAYEQVEPGRFDGMLWHRKVSARADPP